MDQYTFTDRASLVTAAEWVQHLLTGQIATLVATIAIAAVGATMLSGRIQTRRGIVVVAGCFVIFSASFIANGLISGVSTAPAPSPVLPLNPSYIPAMPAPQPYNPFDPYAGASVPVRQPDPLSVPR